MRSTPTFSQRAIAAAASLALIGAGVVALGHQVEERHEVCAEHGELIHVGVAAGAVTISTNSVLSDNPLDLEHGEHCAIAWSSPETAETSADVATTAPGVRPTEACAADARALDGRTRYRLSPKNSPPA